MNINRRNFLLGMGAILASGLLPDLALANKIAIMPYKDFPALSFYNIHTNEKLSVKYRDKNQYIASAMTEIKDFFRDHRNGEEKDIDPLLIDRIFGLNQYFGGNNVIELISGYRSPASNASLNKKSKSVAKNSYHLKGMAADIFLPEKHLAELYQVAKLQNSGGSGIYVRSNFVHVDTGPVRSW